MAGGLKNLEELLNNENYQPTTKEILEMLETSDDMDEEMKANIRSMLVGDTPQVFGGPGSGTLLAISLIFMLFLIILFFGYKLYKSLKEKEKKREEKKKLKQLKKKK